VSSIDTRRDRDRRRDHGDAVTRYLGLTRKGRRHRGRWLLLMIHLRHAAAAIAPGLCRTVLITHGESDRDQSRRQFEQPCGSRWSLGDRRSIGYETPEAFRQARQCVHLRARD
jgi:hypothetical protein